MVAEKRHNGLLLFFVAGIVVALVWLSCAPNPCVQKTTVLMGDIRVKLRADNHAFEKHGTSAWDYLRRHNYQEVWHSEKRQAFMVDHCDVRTNMCAVMFLGARDLKTSNLSLLTRAELDALIDNRLQLTCFWMPRARLLRKAAIDQYVRLWPRG